MMRKNVRNYFSIQRGIINGVICIMPQTHSCSFIIHQPACSCQTCSGNKLPAFLWMCATWKLQSEWEMCKFTRSQQMVNWIVQWLKKPKASVKDNYKKVQHNNLKNKIKLWAPLSIFLMKDKIDILNIGKISSCQFVMYMLLPNIFMVWSETRRESHKHRKNQHNREGELTCKKPSIKGANKGSLHRQVTVQLLKHHLSLLFLLSYLRYNIHQTTICNGSGTQDTANIEIIYWKEN